MAAARATLQPLHVKMPPPLQLNENAIEERKLFMQLFKNYQIITVLEQRDKAYQCVVFLQCTGTAGIKIYNGLEFASAGPGNTIAEDNEDIRTIIEKFDKYIIGETNQTYERYVFNKRDKKPEESVELYISALKDMLQSCNFCDYMRDSSMRVRIVLGICDNSTRKMLLQRRNISLKDAVDICRGYEFTKQQMTSISTNASVYVDVKENTLCQGKDTCEKWTGQLNATTTVQILWRETHTQKKNVVQRGRRNVRNIKRQNHFAVCCQPDIRKRVNNLDHQEEHIESVESDSEFLANVMKQVSTLEQENKSHSGPIYV